MQILATRRHRIAPTKMVIIKKQVTASAGRDVNWNSSVAHGNVKWHIRFGKQFGGSSKLNVGLPCYSAMLLLGIFQEKKWKYTSTQELPCESSQQHIHKCQTTTETTSWWMDEWNVVYHTMECYSASKGTRRWYTLATQCSDLGNSVLNEGSQTLKSQSGLFHLYGILETGKSVVN